MAGKTKFPQVQWEDEDTGFGDMAESSESSDEFAALLGDDQEDDEEPMFVGAKVKGTVSSLPDRGHDVLIELPGKSSGIVDRAELLDESGALTVKVGDELELFVVSRRGDELILSQKMNQSLRSLEDLEAAYAKRLAVKGRVLKVNKGGFEVQVLGKTAFCPISQIDTRFVENGADYVGKEFEFLIQSFESKGRNIVLNRATLLKQRAEERAQQLLADLKPDTILDGKVTQLRDFGAFVDIGGLEGMVHVSEISYSRIAKAGDVLTVGDAVRVKVLKIETVDGKRRIALSIKSAAQDPWDTVGDQIKQGETYTGRVVRLMDFGAFVELQPGFEGLLHISEMSWVKRIHHPSDLVKVGDMVSVTVKEINSAQRRISLSMKQIEDDPWFEATGRFPVGKTLEGEVEKLKGFGAIVQLAPGLSGMVPTSVLRQKFGEAYRQHALPSQKLAVRVVEVDANARKVRLSLQGVDEDENGRDDYLEYVRSENETKAANVATKNDPGRVGSFGALLGAKINAKKN